MVSHVAWLNEAGKVLAITWPDYITEANIQYLLAGNSPGWRVKADLVEYDGQQPLLSFNKAAGYNLVPEQPSYVFWSKANPGLDAKLYRAPLQGGNRITFINAAYSSLIGMAVGGCPRHTNLIQAPDSMLPYLIRPENMYYDDWLIRYTSCFEMFVPGRPNEALVGQIIKDAVESRLGVRIQYDSIPTPVWEISGTGKPLTDKKETIRNRVYDWNFHTPVPIVFIPALAKSGFAEAPLPHDLASFPAFERWCLRNNLAARQTTRKLRILIIQSKQ
jgi:hypothetical protein